MQGEKDDKRRRKDIEDWILGENVPTDVMNRYIFPVFFQYFRPTLPHFAPLFGKKKLVFNQLSEYSHRSKYIFSRGNKKGDICGDKVTTGVYCCKHKKYENQEEKLAPNTPPKKEIKKMMMNAGLKNIKFSNRKPYWTAIGYKR